VSVAADGGEKTPLRVRGDTLQNTEARLALPTLAGLLPCVMAGTFLLALSWRAEAPSWVVLVRVACAALFALPNILNVLNLVRDGSPSIGMLPLSVCSLAPASALGLVCLTGAGRLASAILLVPSLSCILFFSLWCLRLYCAYTDAEAVAEGATIVCLGGAVRDGQPRPTLRLRLDAAAACAEQAAGTTLIVSGAAAEGGAESEAQVMRAYLMRRGIAEERILVEDRARTTRENIAYSCALADEAGLTGQVCICSSDYHLFRTLREARRLGIVATPIAAPTPALTAPQQWCREVLTVVVTFGPLG